VPSFVLFILLTNYHNWCRQ